MAYGEWNGGVIDDVTWPWKVKVMNHDPNMFGAHYLHNGCNTDLGAMEQLYVMSICGPNGHVIDNGTWLWKAKVMAPISA